MYDSFVCVFFFQVKVANAVPTNVVGKPCSFKFHMNIKRSQFPSAGKEFAEKFLFISIFLFSIKLLHTHTETHPASNIWNWTFQFWLLLLQRWRKTDGKLVESWFSHMRKGNNFGTVSPSRALASVLEFLTYLWAAHRRRGCGAAVW